MTRRICLITCLALLLATLLGGPSFAANITTSGPPAIWPETPEVEVADPDDSLTPDSTKGDQFGTLSQTFQVDSAFDLRTVYLRYKNRDGFTGNLTADFTIYNVADVLTSPLVLGAAVTTESVVFPELFNNDTDHRIAQILLDSTVNLPATGGITGYAIEFTNISSEDDPNATGGWSWYRTGSTSGNVYLQGQAFANGVQKGDPFGEPDASRDFSLALSSELPIPEPSTMMLAGLMSIVAFSCRRTREK